MSAATGTDCDDEIVKALLDFPGTFLSIAHLFIPLGIQVDVENQDNNTPLHYFCQKFVSPTCVSVGEKLLKLGESVSLLYLFISTSHYCQ